MVRGDEWTGLIKVCQVLQKTGCMIEGHYTVLTLERLLTLNQLMDLSKLMQSTVKPYLLIVACEENQQLDEETKDVIRTIIDTIKQIEHQNHIYHPIRRQHRCFPAPREQENIWERFCKKG
jgi:hypothetical protein